MMMMMMMMILRNGTQQLARPKQIEKLEERWPKTPLLFRDEDFSYTGNTTCNFLHNIPILLPQHQAL
jgi:hypothetical protein